MDTETKNALGEYWKHILDIKRRIVAMESVQGAMQAFLGRQYGPDAKTQMQELFKDLYSDAILGLEKKDPQLATLMDIRGNLPSEQWEDWFGRE